MRLTHECQPLEAKPELPDGVSTCSYTWRCPTCGSKYYVRVGSGTAEAYPSHDPLDPVAWLRRRRWQRSLLRQ